MLQFTDMQINYTYIASVHIIKTMLYETYKRTALAVIFHVNL